MFIKKKLCHITLLLRPGKFECFEEQTAFNELSRHSGLASRLQKSQLTGYLFGIVEGG